VTSVALAGLSQALVIRISAKYVMAAGMGLIGGAILWATAVPANGHFWNDLAQAADTPNVSRSDGAHGLASRSLADEEGDPDRLGLTVQKGGDRAQTYGGVS
jgi:hypothetical protein